MTAGTWFWLIYVLCALLGVFFNWPWSTQSGGQPPWRPLGWVVVELILFGLLGWGVFGPPIR